MRKIIVGIVGAVVVMAMFFGFVTLYTHSTDAYDKMTTLYNNLSHTIQLPTTIELIKKEEDLQKETLPQTLRTSSSNIIYIDPGHDGENYGVTHNGTSVGDKRYGTTTGGTFPDGVTEAKNNLDIALKVRDKLMAAGYICKLSHETITGGDSIGNYYRGKEAYSCGAALVICIHTNGSGGKGFMVLAPSDADRNQTAAQDFYDRMTKETQVGPNSNWKYNEALNIFSAYTGAGGDPQSILYLEVGAHEEASEAQYIESDVGIEAIAKVISEVAIDTLSTQTTVTPNPTNPTNPVTPVTPVTPVNPGSAVPAPMDSNAAPTSAEIFQFKDQSGVLSLAQCNECYITWGYTGIWRKEVVKHNYRELYNLLVAQGIN